MNLNMKNYGFGTLFILLVLIIGYAKDLKDVKMAEAGHVQCVSKTNVIILVKGCK